MILSRADAALIAAGAGLMTLAYPPFTLVVPAFVCLVPAALLILRGHEQADPWRWRLGAGFCYGVVTHGVLLHWLATSLWAYGRGAVVLYPVAVALFSGVTALVFAAVGRISDVSERRLVFALPAGIVLIEWLAGQVDPISLPWHQLALTVASTPLLLQTADIAGAEGLSFLLAVINTLLALAWHSRARRRRALGFIEAAASLVFIMGLYGAHRLATVPLQPRGTVAVVQPGVGVDEKWRPEFMDEVVERTVRLTERVVESDRPDLVVWPETALPDPIDDHPNWRTNLTGVARRSGVTLLVGAVEGSSGAETRTRANAVVSFDPRLTIEDQAEVLYRKQKLIPFVERLTLAGVSLSRAGGEGFRAGGVLETADGPVGRYGTVICYELTFPGLARTLRRSGAEVLFVLSNDAWLGRGATEQSFAHAALRAVENRMPVVRSANRGVSGVVDPLGRVVTRTSTVEESYAVGTVERAAVLPMAVRLGGFSGPAVGLVLLLSLAATFRRTAGSSPGDTSSPEGG